MNQSSTLYDLCWTWRVAKRSTPITILTMGRAMPAARISAFVAKATGNWVNSDILDACTATFQSKRVGEPFIAEKGDQAREKAKRQKKKHERTKKETMWRTLDRIYLDLRAMRELTGHLTAFICRIEVRAEGNGQQQR